MSSFINKSVDYSQTMLLKGEILAPMLRKYNKEIAEKETSHNKCPLLGYHIPNNGKKYWMLVTFKHRIVSSLGKESKENYNLLYFFNNEDNFCIEINREFDNEFLFEGYLYGNSTQFLITDILMKDTEVIHVDYPLRFALINEIVFFSVKGSLTRLNNHLSIGIHPVLCAKNEGMVKILMTNFTHKHEITNVETVIDHVKRCEAMPKMLDNHSPVRKVITKGGFSDVYNVFDEGNHCKEGILYVKGMSESKMLKDLFKTQQQVVLDCVFNPKVNKWMPVTC